MINYNFCLNSSSLCYCFLLILQTPPLTQLLRKATVQTSEFYTSLFMCLCSVQTPCDVAHQKQGDSWYCDVIVTHSVKYGILLLLLLLSLWRQRSAMDVPINITKSKTLLESFGQIKPSFYFFFYFSYVPSFHHFHLSLSIGVVSAPALAPLKTMANKMLEKKTPHSTHLEIFFILN